MNLAAVCTAGIITLHMLFPDVLQNFPNRACPECDGYIAPVDCNEVGEDQSIFLPDRGTWLTVRAADCVTWKPPAEPPRKGGKVWLGDLDQAIYDRLGLPYAPLDAIVCRAVAARPVVSTSTRPAPTLTPLPARRATDQLTPDHRLRRQIVGEQ